MSTAEECIHGLEAAWCSLCLASPEALATGPRYRRPIPAQYDGHCSGCNLPIRPGELIVNDVEAWVHDGCERPTRRSRT